MRINKIIIENIHSIKGKYEINFEQKPFIGTGIFAITGETGAGKTTILDAITLALFERTPRHDGQRSEKLAELVMSNGEKHCKAEVHFSSKGKKYIAEWAATRNRNFKMNAPKHTIHDGDGQILNDHKREVSKLIEEILDLDYDRFLRAVMLSQGQFASFLHSSHKDRADILEKITGTAIFSEISKKAFEKNKELQTNLKIKSEQLKQFEILSQEDFEILKKQKEDLTEEIKNFESLKGKLLIDKDRFLTLEKTNAEFEKTKEKIEKIKLDIQVRAADWEKLELNQKANPYKEKLGLRDEFEKQKNAEELHLLEKKKQVLQAESDVKNLEEQHYNADKNAQTAASEFEQKTTFVHEEITPIDNEIAIFENEIEKIETEIKAIKRQISDENQTFSTIKTQILEIENAQKNAENENQNLTPFEKINLPMFKKLAEELLDIRNEYSQADKAKKLTEKNIEAKTNDLNDSKTQFAELQKQLEKLISDKEKLEKQMKNLLENEKKEQILAEWETSKEKNEVLKIVFDNEKSRQKICLELEHLTEKEQRETTILSKNEAEKTQNLNEKNIAERELILIKQEEYLVIQNKKLTDYRAQLTENEPCPLCGALHHPYAQDLPEFSSEDDVKKRRIQLEEKIAAQQKMDENLGKTNTQSATEIKHLQVQMAGKTALEQDLKQKFVEISKKLKYKIPNNLSEIELLIVENEKITATSKKRFDEISKFEIQLAKFPQLEAEKKDAANQLTILIAKLENDLQNLVKEKDDAVQKMKTALEIGKEKNDELTKILAETGEIVPKKEGFDVLFAKISAHKITFANNQTLINESKNKLSALEAKKESTEKLIFAFGENLKNKTTLCAEIQNNKAEKMASRFSKLKEKDTKLFLQKLKDEKINAENDLAIVAKNLLAKTDEKNAFQTQIQSISAALETVSLKLSEADKDLLFESKNAGFETISALRNAILSPDLATELAQNRDNLEMKKNKEESQKSLLEKQILEAKMQLPENSSLEKTEEDLQNIKNLHEQRQQEFDKINTQFIQNTTNIEKREKLQIDFETEKNKASRWEKLSKLIGSAKGDGDFRSFAQSLTLSVLINLANAHLTRLNKRYAIFQHESERAELALHICDHFQNDQIRPVKTLSGGETFLVSLAMALGLSDLASGKKAKFESLFIDEGFGTLDVDTLEIALDAIENLQNGNKLIGVISHVELLKERIHTKIIVKKGKAGVSSIEVFPN